MPRWLEAIIALVALICLSPILLGAALLVWLGDGRPVLFRHYRVGFRGELFPLYKFRTMRIAAGPSVTSSKDPRVTRVGAFLRKTKIDELPQLFNVLLGQMSFVGPRPEVKEFVDLYTPEQRKVLEVRPGITDPASIAYHNESELLGQVADWRQHYVATIMPDKLRISLNYLDKRTCWTDFALIFSTVGKLVKTRLGF